MHNLQNYPVIFSTFSVLIPMQKKNKYKICWGFLLFVFFVFLLTSLRKTNLDKFIRTGIRDIITE